MSLFGVLAEILFVGHSLVGPGLPPLVEAGLSAMEAPANVEAQIINGAPLSWNWENSARAEGVDARARLAGGRVSALILTEAQPIAAQVQWNDSAGLVARWAGLAGQSNPDARVFVYETWPSLASAPGVVIEGDPGAGTPWRQRLTDELPLWVGIAGDGVGIIPAGQAMGALADAVAAGQVPGIDDIRDVFSDDIHLNGKGQYFVAMVHLAALTGRSPEGIPAKLMRSWPNRESVIGQDTAEAMQRIAWQTVQDFPALQAEIRATLAAAPPVAAVAAEGPEPAAAEADPEAAWQAPPLPAVTPLTNPALALGLAGVNDWSTQAPFLDLMKTARPWTGHLPGQWGGWGEAELRAAGALDARGWPLRLPAEITGLSTLVLTDLPEDAGGLAGRYVLTHQGRGTLTLEGRATVLSAEPGRVVFDFTPGPGAVIVTLTAIDEADPIRAMTIVRADREAALAAGELFNPDWLALIGGVKGLRFMDWMATNDSTVATPADRPLPDDYTWARGAGVPVEVMVALANRLQADPWFTVPHLANDALVTEMAQIVARDLDPGLKAWVEYSNEVWNGQFAQARWAEEMARLRWPGSEGAGVQFYALRAAEVMALWTAAMPAERVVRVVATQTGVKGLEEMILQAPRVLEEGLPAPAGAFDAYAVTGYVSGLLGADHKLGAVRDWIAQAQAAGGDMAPAFDLAAQEMRNGGVTGRPEDTLDQLLTDTLPHHAAVAARAGLRLVMYEGGTHVVGYGPAVEDGELTTFFTAFNYSPQMGAIYADLLAGWARVSDAPFNGFVDVATPTKWGSWGALRHLGDDNPRWRALAGHCGGASC